MRPQFNIPMDDYPELPEKIRKLCKVRGYRISDFCSRVLSEAVERETSELSNYEPTEQRLNRIESELGELRSRMGQQSETLKLLGDSYNENVPELKNDVWLLEKLMFSDRPTIPQEIITQLKDLLDAKKYPVAKLRSRLVEIINRLENG